MSFLQDNIESIIEKSMESNRIPGAAFAVIQNNEIILSKGFGRTTLEEWGTPVGPNTLFRIASVSKLFTGTVMMMLVEKGLIDLDKTVQDYIPWFTTADPERSKLITIRMLLSHSSGLPTGGGLSFHYNESALLEYMKEVVPTLPILFDPGTAYSYGNHALNIAGFVATQVTNKPFATLIQEMLFDPLEMTQTTYQPLRAMTQSLALAHEHDQNGKLVPAQQFFDNAASYPSYYAFSSIADLIKFAQFHLNEGLYQNNQILQASSIKEMRSEQSKWYNLSDGGCGITFFKETKDGITRFWHYGQYSHQYSSQFILVPEKGIAVIALANGENIFQAGYEIVDELLKQEKSPRQEELQTNDEIPNLANYQATYLHSYYGLFQLDQEGENWNLIHDGQAYELTPYRNDIFVCKDEQGQIRFTVGFPKFQTQKCLMINSSACPEFVQDYQWNPEDWKAWQGRYDDGRESYEVYIEENQFIIQEQPTNKRFVGQAIKHNQFLTKEYGLIRFIDVHGQTNLEFGYAWRYPKQME
ncbi:serine hydrolase domain-containing protein [Pseudoneobacillus sp. C159]